MAHPASGIIDYFTRHRTAANLLLVLLIVAGIAAFPRMRAQYFPDVILDSVNVTVGWDGAGAEDVDNAIVDIMEPALLAVEGVESSSSTSREGRASIRLEFEANWDMARATEDVQQAVDAISDLPEGSDDPNVRRSVWRDRVTDVIISGPVGVDQLARFSDEFASRLFAQGVTRTTIRGIAAPEILVEVPSTALITNDISMAEIAAAIAAEADAAPAGDVTGANARVRTGVAKRTPEQINGIVLRSGSDGQDRLTIGDVAQITVAGVDRERGYFVGDNPAISVRIDRSSRGDAIEIQRQVEDVAADMMLGLPRGVTIELIRARSEEISGRLRILLENGLTGLALVVGLLFLFLNARTAIWVAAGIPVAMFAAIFLMWAAGLTLNMISLFALLITLGIVVDDAIVVGEHADFRARRLGEAPADAASNAARRMVGPVFSATITTVIAFSALTLVEGRFGELIADIPFTVTAVLIASLVECFLILPNHMNHALAASSGRLAWYDYPSHYVNKGFDWFRSTLFRRFIAFVIWARYPVLALLFVVLASQAVLVIRGEVQWRFFSAPEEGSVSGNFAMVPGATREDTVAQMRALQAAVDALGREYAAEHGRNPVAYSLAEIGGNTGRGLAGVDGKESYQLGSIAVELIDADLRPYASAVFVQDLQERVARHPMTETLAFRRWRGGPGGDAIDIQLFGAGTPQLKTAAEALKSRLAQFGEVSALEDSLAYDKEELILDLTPQGQALGFTIDGLGSILRNRLGGIEAATFPVGSRSASVRVELPEGELTADFLSRTQMRSPDGVYVPLADIVRVERSNGFSTIIRENGIRLVSVTGDLDDENAARAEEIMTIIADTILPELQEEFGVSFKMDGLSAQERDFLSDALVGFGFCLVGIYLTLAWVFSSWTRPALIMAIIPFGLIGTIYGHAAWGLPLSMFTVVGLIGMSGIIINDSIVLVTTVDEYSENRGLVPAIIDGVADRLRPVLLTTLTTVIGLTPLLFEPSRQAQFLKPTVITLVYGLGFGMFLVLLIVPALLAMQMDFHRQTVAFKRAMRLQARSGFASAVTLVGVLGTLGIFAATLGHVVLLGGFWGPVQGLAPWAGQEPSAMLGFAVFVALTGLWLLLLFALAGAMRLMTGRAARV
ncbi:efflux RND transporter permease subunit [Alphaproteobacteria bacterium KMM 3653]|uniref:Efflux RND transporter permease subunit n=1 Tax=Harenicola maris TaxID=2841044 RepID=A0AAP2CR60_9RHOB|nr:efflux RND transporter permease subunit [Harenicola maris]